jgi:hypothetical protein
MATPVVRHASSAVWSHLLALAIIGTVGMLVAEGLQLFALGWPNLLGICAWWVALCIVVAASLQSRV